MRWLCRFLPELILLEEGSNLLLTAIPSVEISNATLLGKRVIGEWVRKFWDLVQGWVARDSCTCSANRACSNDYSIEAHYLCSTR